MDGPFTISMNGPGVSSIVLFTPKHITQKNFWEQPPLKWETECKRPFRIPSFRRRHGPSGEIVKHIVALGDQLIVSAPPCPGIERFGGRARVPLHDRLERSDREAGEKCGAVVRMRGVGVDPRPQDLRTDLGGVRLLAAALVQPVVRGVLVHAGGAVVDVVRDAAEHPGEDGLPIAKDVSGASQLQALPVEAAGVVAEWFPATHLILGVGVENPEFGLLLFELKLPFLLYLYCSVKSLFQSFLSGLSRLMFFQ